jgi:hypothetical protein
MVSISFRDSCYPNHRALLVFSPGFTETFHSANRGCMIVELVKKHGEKTDFGWENGFNFRAEVSDKVLNLIRRLVNMKRNMTSSDRKVARLIGTDGNVFALLGVTGKYLDRANRRDLSKKL